jgi:iron complex transport system substrate-binding protein
VPPIQPSPPGAPLPRRAFLLGAAGLAAATLAACSSSGGTSSPEGSGSGSGDPTGSADSEAGSTADGAFPVTVPGKLGSVTVDRPPKRVVAVGFLRDTDLAIALGANLVGAVKSGAYPAGLAPWEKPPHSPELLDASSGLPFEKIAALRPDLILAADDYTLAKDYATLTRIAPTLSYAQAVGIDSWPEMTTRAGAVLGRAAEAKALVTRVQAQIAAARQQNPQLAGKTFTFGPVSDPSTVYTINSTADASAQFFGQLGMTLSPKVTPLPSSSTPRRAQISLEQLSLIEADIVILTYQTDKIRQQFEADPLFKKLPAVRQGRYIALDYGVAVGLAFPSVLSIPYGLGVTVPKLVAAATKV